jgi:uncharacterized membrane protein
MLMGIGYQIHQSELIVLGIFLALIGLGFLIKIDFTVGVWILFGSLICFSQAHARGEKAAVPDQDPVADD